MTQESIKSSTIIGGAGQYGRAESDFYETPLECTVALLRYVKQQTWWINPKRVLEPCCGDGAIVRILRHYGYFVSTYDIRETKCADLVGDYLLTQCGADAIITNPPFNLAEEFIRKAIMEAPIVAMLLKSNFWHTKKRQKLFEETTPVAVLPLTWRPAMSPERGKSPTMDFQWTIWSKYETGMCQYKPLIKPILNETEYLQYTNNTQIK